MYMMAQQLSQEKKCDNCVNSRNITARQIFKFYTGDIFRKLNVSLFQKLQTIGP